MKRDIYFLHKDKPHKRFGKKNRHRSICLAVVVVSISFLLNCCGSSHEEKPQPEEVLVAEPVTVSQHPYLPDTLSISDTSGVKQEATSIVEESKPQAQSQPVSETKISRYYEEGYEKGYDDGEDDAVAGNGWEGQYDDECPYTGQKKKEYQLGYEEGYEAGYYDNSDGDE